MTIYLLIHDIRKEYSIIERKNNEEQYNKITNPAIQYYEITRWIDIREYLVPSLDQMTEEDKEYIIEGFGLKDYKLTVPKKKDSYNYRHR